MSKTTSGRIARRLLPAILVAMILAVGGVAPVVAQSCDPAAIAQVIDETGARLRRITTDGQPAFRSKLRELAQARGLTEADAETRAYALLEDTETQALDEQAGALLNTLDRLGDETTAQGAVCDRLAEARTTAAQLIEVTTAKSLHLAARLDAELLPKTGRIPDAPRVAQPRVPELRIAEPKAPAEPRAPEAKEPQKTARLAPPVPPVVPGAPKDTSSWSTSTNGSVTTNSSAYEIPPQLPGMPYAAPTDQTFTHEDIMAAGRGFFGSISAGLASVTEWSFQKLGRPSGYILGSEGGGALLAGLRYGEGTLVTKAGIERKVYWQGPSIGYDFGLTGSRVMFLVYNIKDADEMFARFAGVDGSAYLVGGVGITVLKKGRLLLAPIRTGLGLRFGANVGYLKFTPEPSYNPF